MGASALYQQYKAWALRVGRRQLSQTRFGGRFKGRFKKEQRDFGIVYLGLELKPTAEQSTTAGLEKIVVLEKAAALEKTAARKGRKFGRNAPPNGGSQESKKRVA